MRSQFVIDCGFARSVRPLCDLRRLQLKDGRGHRAFEALAVARIPVVRSEVPAASLRELLRGDYLLRTY